MRNTFIEDPEAKGCFARGSVRGTTNGDTRGAWKEVHRAGHSANDAGDTCERSRWFAVQTRPHCETRARLHLTNQGYATFLPLMLGTRRHARKTETVSAPLFPCYLFVSLDLARDQWRSVNGTVGVVSLVMPSGVPAPVPHGIVETLKASMEESGIVRFDAGLQRGQNIRVTAGPFAEFLGSLDRIDDAGRARVLLEIMGGQVPVTLPGGAIIPAAR